jgi:hypothetical protein
MSGYTESFTERVASRYEGVNADSKFEEGDERYGSFIAIIELLLPMLLETLGNCNDNNEQKVLDNARKPSRFNKALFTLKVRRECKDSDDNISPRKLRDAVLEETAALSDDEGFGVIREGKGTDFLLI